MRTATFTVLLLAALTIPTHLAYAKCGDDPFLTCEGSCGGTGWGGCACDIFCDWNFDCCPDYEECCLACEPDCAGKECGDDGCGGSCGTCTQGEECVGGNCVEPCEPDCTGKECGDDGCGGSCGTCPPGITWSCTAQGVCECTPVCQTYGAECGDDGCGGSCGDCPGELVCAGGKCVEQPCTPACTAKECGPDGCGGQCPPGCGAGFICNVWGQCVPGACEPDCAGKECGDDGCGGSCGTCTQGDECVGGKCIEPCEPDCAGKECGDDGCGGSCGECAEGHECDQEGKCLPPSTGDTGLHEAEQDAGIADDALGEEAVEDPGVEPTGSEAAPFAGSDATTQAGTCPAGYVLNYGRCVPNGQAGGTGGGCSARPSYADRPWPVALLFLLGWLVLQGPGRKSRIRDREGA